MSELASEPMWRSELASERVRTGPLPLVGIPSYHLVLGRVSGWVTGGYALPDHYVSAVRRAGLRPVILPGHDPAPAEEVLDGLDGLLLAGGGDVDPGRYGADASEHVYGTDTERDDLEAGLVPAALALGLPTLAICRGLQVINVAFGGTLEQHLPDRLGLTHGDPVGGLSAWHPVRVEPGSRLGAAIGSTTLDRCTSHHHQGVDRLGEGLVPVAWTDDGLVEALEAPPGGPWMTAVQWHPEATAADDPAQQALFDAFAAEVSRSRTPERTPERPPERRGADARRASR